MCVFFYYSMIKSARYARALFLCDWRGDELALIFTIQILTIVDLSQVIESLRRHDFLIYEQMESQEIECAFLRRYNQIYPEKPLRLPGSPVLLLAVRRE